jgi:hypothetical protein
MRHRTSKLAQKLELQQVELQQVELQQVELQQVELQQVAGKSGQASRRLKQSASLH